MIAAWAFFDVAMRPVAAGEHARSSKRARTSCPLVTAACG